MSIFSKLSDINCPESLACDASGKNPSFEVSFRADGIIPFPQVILHGEGRQKIIKDDAIGSRADDKGGYIYTAKIPAGLFAANHINIQIEGCRQADLSRAGGDDWIKVYRNLRLEAPPRAARKIEIAEGVKVYFGIHKHMHQPYYRAADPDYWDGEKDEIFGSRVGNYTGFLPAAVRQYDEGNLPHAGLSTSWSGSLIEQLDRCEALGLCGGRFSDWKNELRGIAGAKTALGNPRMAFSAFGYFHPLMALIPARNIVRHIQWHQDAIRAHFGVEASKVLFPPETAFHVRMIPALKEAGIEAVIYDSIHRYRACRDYPYAGINEGMLPPNPAEQVNPPVDDWLQLHNIWAGSKISPSLMRPEYIAYEDPDGNIHKIIGIPAERYIGNEDARGGFGALQYPDVLGQVYDRIVETGSFDPKHPPFFLLHSDGDNHGGGADSYYHHNTGELVRWLQEDPRFELTTSEDYLRRFPPDPAQAVHIEPGSWSGADNGDPQFMKWFSRYDQSYSPDLNSWAALTALQNLVHTIEDSAPEHAALQEASRLMLTAETSCYWYWTGQDVWDKQVTEAANKGWQLLGSAVKQVGDRTGPTIFAPWVTPENPGGDCWGQGCLKAAPREATLHTFIHDLSGLKRTTLVLRTASGEKRLDLNNHGPYPSHTGASVSADYCTASLPVGAGNVRYYIEAEDSRGNVSRSALERIYLA
ncbi:glycosyl hydrolase family 57 [Methylotuvimicrobium sp.]|uniref:glycosyl hydrolase family 57 n=1 Tax=Methylotuvimicrobium sp. TaxID=2822413 RepID=UPI003D64F56A